MNVSVTKEATHTLPKGFSAAGVSCGVKESSEDLGLITCEVPATAAAVYTINAVQAAPLQVTRKSLEVEGKLQAFIVNSGNANAFTGEQGLQDARQMQSQVANQLQIPEHLVGVASTGVIGNPLPMSAILTGIPQCVKQLQPTGAANFSQAILTTDTVTKVVETEVEIDQKTVKISGCAKGSGMVHPQMATILGFVTTDAEIAYPSLQGLLKQSIDETFNMITVDGDCSTNDMVSVMASGLAENQSLHPEHPDWLSFQTAFLSVCKELAKQIARDGEGATRLIEAQVDGAVSKDQAKKVAKAIVGSNLVKSAVFGTDANWGRIVSAVGQGDPTLSVDRLDLWIGEVPIVQGGKPLVFDENQATQALQQDKVVLMVHLHYGTESAVAWGCDLTYEYIKINASYRT